MRGYPSRVSSMEKQKPRSSRLLRSSALLLASVLGGACSPASNTAPRSPALDASAPPLLDVPAADTHPLERAEARHLLNRFTFGARASDLEAAAATTARSWMARQLEPEAIDDAAASEQLTPYRTVFLPPAEVREAYMKEIRRPKSGTGVFRKRAINTRRLIEHAQMVQFIRQAVSERQVYEIMVDFWFNHFNVYVLKDPVKVLITDYIEHAIRPHALGRFEDLLVATARHPAMLVYLDNHRSSAAQATGNKHDRSGITENYARELLELHTLGVHGGYTQQDVIEVARILTGWTLQDLPGSSYGFAFKPAMHDHGSKVVLGVTYAPQRGEEEGLELLKRLAAHPATAKRLATKLCVRFIADTPPPRCVEQLTKAYVRTGGDIRTLLKTLVALPDFWQHPRAKLKSPNLYLVSAYRALGTLPKGATEYSKLADALGEPKLLQPAPTGYNEDPEGWSSTASVIDRMNFAMAAAESAVPKSQERVEDAEIVRRINQSLFAGFASASTLAVLSTQIGEQRGIRQKVRTATALGLGSPDFQYH